LDKFEEKLLQIKVDKPEAGQFQQQLRRQLIEKYVKEKPTYQTHFRLAFGLACLLVFFAVLTVADPRVALKLNELTWNNFQPEKMEQRSNDAFARELEYTTINNPQLMQQIDAGEYEEEKAYIIRKYRSHNNKPVMVVSEYKSQPGSMIKQTSGKGI